MGKEDQAWLNGVSLLPLEPSKEIHEDFKALLKDRKYRPEVFVISFQVTLEQVLELSEEERGERWGEGGERER